MFTLDPNGDICQKAVEIYENMPVQNIIDYYYWKKEGKTNLNQEQNGVTFVLRTQKLNSKSCDSLNPKTQLKPKCVRGFQLFSGPRVVEITNTKTANTLQGPPWFTTKSNINFLMDSFIKEKFVVTF